MKADPYYSDDSSDDLIRECDFSEPFGDSNHQNLQLQASNLFEIFQTKLLELESAITKNSTTIAHLLQQQEQILQLPKWHKLLQIQSANILVFHRKTLQLLGINDAAKQFLNGVATINLMQKPSTLFASIPPLLLLLELNVLNSNTVQLLSLKIYLPFMTVLLHVRIHVERDAEYYWLEIAAVPNALFDDSFVMNKEVVPATVQIVLNISQSADAVAYQTYLKHSNQRDCNMIAKFVQQNDHKFVVETSHLLQHVFTAEQ